MVGRREGKKSERRDRGRENLDDNATTEAARSKKREKRGENGKWWKRDRER